MAFTKITQAELESRGATTLPNQPTISASLLKQEFDAPAKEIVAPAFNNLIDELEADTAADSLGVSMPEGRTGDPTIQGAIDSISEDLGTAEGKVTELEGLKHSHSNKATIDKFSEASDNLYWNGSPVGGGGGTSDYVDLENKPQINNVTLIGNMSAHDLGLATESALANKVDKETGKGLSSNDYTDGEKADVAKIDTIEGNVGTLTSSVGIVQGKVTTLEGQMYSVQDDLDDKVDKVEGQGLSTNDYTNADKAKVNALGTASTKNSTSIVTESSDLVESGAVKDIVGWGNKNKLPVTINRVKALNTTGTWSGNTYTRNGLTFTISTDTQGNVTEIDINGTSGSGYTYFNVANMNIGSDAMNSIDNPHGNGYTLSAGDTIPLIYSPSSYNFVFSISANTTINHKKVYPLLETGNTATSFEPYHESVSDSLAEKCDNSVIGTVEDGTNPTKSYAVNEFMVRDGAFCQVTAPVTTSSTWTEGSNYTKKSIAEVLQSLMS